MNILKRMVVLFILFNLSIFPTGGEVEFETIFYEDFSDWSNLEIMGDNPSGWVNNTDPATYQTQEGGTFGTYLNILDSYFEIVDPISISWDILFTATATEFQRRFVSLWCYITDGTELRATISLWDGKGGLWLSSMTNGSQRATQHVIPWMPEVWRTISLEIIFDEMSSEFLNFYLLLDGDYYGNSSRHWPVETSFRMCSFYAYQNNWGIGDTIMIDNFNVQSSNTNNTVFDTNNTVFNTNNTVFNIIPFHGFGITTIALIGKMKARRKIITIDSRNTV